MMGIDRLWQLFALPGSFKKNALIMMGATALAQLFTVLCAPVLTRLYEPSAFGVFGVYMSIVSIIAAIVTLRYDQALMLPRENRDAVALSWVSMTAVLAVSLITALVVMFFSDVIVETLKVPALRSWLFLLPVSVFFGGFILTLNAWEARQKQFSVIAAAQVARSTTAGSGQIIGGVAQTGFAGLLGGQLFGDLVMAAFLAWKVLRSDANVFADPMTRDRAYLQARAYVDFPLFSGAQNFLNVVSQNIPVLLLAKFFSPAVVGWYALGVRVIQIPLGFILSSFNQVFFQKASEVYNAGEDTFVLFKKATGALGAVVALPALVVILWGPLIFGFVLGQNWSVAGEYARWLVLWLVVGFINPPAMIFIQIYRKQHLLLIQDIALLICRLSVIVAGGLWLKDPLKTIILYSMVGFVFNLVVVVYMWIFLAHSSFQRGLDKSRGAHA